MISYCIAAFRHRYTSALIEDLHEKTSVPYEILVWINGPDDGISAFIDWKKREGVAVEIVGHSPENIGMNAYKELFLKAKYDLIVQLDDDVLLVSRKVAEIAAGIFERHPKVMQLVADVWQDEFTTGARPSIDQYREVDKADGLQDGPIDGWFSIYRRSILPLLLEAPYERYFFLGSFVREKLRISGLQGLLCRRMKVFHACGPIYARCFGYLDFEIEKFRSIGNHAAAKYYEIVKSREVDMGLVKNRIREVEDELDMFVG